MKCYTLLSSLCLTWATPAPAQAYDIVTYDNNFEDIFALPGIGTIFEVGKYHDLYWNFLGGDIAAKRSVKRDSIEEQSPNIEEREIKDPLTVVGLVAHTPPNAIYFGPRGNIENGPNFISTSFDGSKTDYFDLYVPEYNGPTIYYGCLGLSPFSSASIPTTCEIAAKGFDKNNNLIAEQTLSFKATSLRQDLTGTRFNSKFKGLSKVTFTGDAPVPIKDLVFDSVITKVYLKK